MIFRAEIEQCSAILGAFKSKTGIKAHLARGTGHRAICSDRRGIFVVGEALESDAVSTQRKDDDDTKIQLCGSCRALLQTCKALKFNLELMNSYAE